MCNEGLLPRFPSCFAAVKAKLKVVMNLAAGPLYSLVDAMPHQLFTFPLGGNLEDCEATFEIAEGLSLKPVCGCVFIVDTAREGSSSGSSCRCHGEVGDRSKGSNLLRGCEEIVCPRLMPIKRR